MKKTIMCFGVFDYLHKGHLSYLKQAKRFGNYLIVVAARDKNVEKIKGKQPKQNEKMRLDKIKRVSFVDKAVLGQLRDYYNIIKKHNPDIICLGYDQKADITKIKNVFKGKIIRCKPYREDIYKSSKLNIEISVQKLV